VINSAIPLPFRDAERSASSTFLSHVSLCGLKLAKTILDRLAIHSDPRQIVPIVNRLVTSVPGIARELVAQYRRSVETIKNGSVFDRAKLISKLTVDVIIADATGGLAGEASASGLLVGDEGLANKAASSLERAVEKADNLGASDLRSDAVEPLVNAAEGKGPLPPEATRLAWDDAKAGRVIGILRESSKYVGDFGLGSGTAGEADSSGNCGSVKATDPPAAIPAS
jgi:hypothetical protein